VASNHDHIGGMGFTLSTSAPAAMASRKVIALL
jgi:hypothetical protein